MGVQFPTFLRNIWNRNDEIQRRDRSTTWFRPDSKLQGKGVVFLAVERDYIPLVHRPNLTVKDVLIEAAKQTKISPVSLDFFTLVTEDNKYILNHQHLITESECKQKYYFKLCFKACCAAELKDIDPEAFRYYFEQCRRDFLDGLLGDFRDSEESCRKYFTLLILEVIWRAQENKVSIQKVIHNPKSYDIHKLYRRSFLTGYKDKEIKAALKAKVELFKDLKEDKFKFEYLHALESTPDFFVHRLTVQKHYFCSGPDRPTKSVVHWEILISKEFGIKKRRVDMASDHDCPEDVVKEFKDVRAIKVDPKNREGIIIERNDASPEVLITTSQQDADYLITLIEGYYRLMVNQYVTLTPETNSSRPKFHGPIERNRAETLLQARAAEDGMYLIRKKRSDHDTMVLSLCYGGKVKHYNIAKKPNGNFAIGSGKAFKDLQSLIEYYTQKNDEKLPVRLTKNIPPSLEGFGALLDHQPVIPTTERPAKLTEDIPQIQEFQIKEQTTIGQGEFGTVKKAVNMDETTSDDEESCKEVILRAIEKGSKAFQEKLFKTAEYLMTLKNSNIASLLGICVSRKVFYLVSKYVAGTPLDNYIKKMSQQNEGIQVSNVFWLGAQIAEGMMYLHGKECIHGRLCAHNVIVEQNGDHVRLTDVGLWKLRLEGAKFCEEDPSKAGYHWWAPESLQNGIFTKESDVWAFGLTLYEMFSMKKPYSNMSKDEIISSYLRAEYLDPTSPNCPRLIEEIIRNCCNPLQEKRGSFRDIVRKFMWSRFTDNESDLDKPMVYLEDDDQPTEAVKGIPDIVLEPIGDSGGDDYSRVASFIPPSDDEPVPPDNENRLQVGVSCPGDGHNDTPNDNPATDLSSKRNKKTIPRSNSFPGARNGKVNSKNPIDHVCDDRKLSIHGKANISRAPSWPATAKRPCEHEWKLADPSETQNREKKISSTGSSPISNDYVQLADTPQITPQEVVNETPADTGKNFESYLNCDKIWKKSDERVVKSSAVSLELLPSPSETPLVNVSPDPLTLQKPREIVRVQHIQSDNKDFKSLVYDTEAYHNNSNTDSDSEEESITSSQSEISFVSEESDTNKSENPNETLQTSKPDTTAFTGTSLQFGSNIVPGFDVSGFLAQDSEETVHCNPLSLNDRTSHSTRVEDSSSLSMPSNATSSFDVDRFLAQITVESSKNKQAPSNPEVKNSASSPLASNVLAGFDIDGLLGKVTTECSQASPLTKNQTSHGADLVDNTNSAMASLAKLSLKLNKDDLKAGSTNKNAFSEFNLTSSPQRTVGSTSFPSTSKSLKTAEEHLSMLWKQHSDREKFGGPTSSAPLQTNRRGEVTQNEISRSDYYEQPQNKRFQLSSDTKASHSSNPGTNPLTLAYTTPQFSHDYHEASMSTKRPTSRPSALASSSTSENIDHFLKHIEYITTQPKKSPLTSEKVNAPSSLAPKLEQKNKSAPSFSLEGWGISGQVTKPMAQKSNQTFSDLQVNRNLKKVEQKDSSVSSGEKSFSFSGLNMSAWGLAEPTVKHKQTDVLQKPRLADTFSLSSDHVSEKTFNKPKQQTKVDVSGVLSLNLPGSSKPIPYGVSETCDDHSVPGNIHRSFPTKPLASSFPKSSLEKTLFYSNILGSKQVESLPNLKNDTNNKTKKTDSSSFSSSAYVDSVVSATSPGKAVNEDNLTASSRNDIRHLLSIDAIRKSSSTEDKIVHRDTSAASLKGSNEHAKLQTLRSSEDIMKNKRPFDINISTMSPDNSNELTSPVQMPAILSSKSTKGETPPKETIELTQLSVLKSNISAKEGQISRNQNVGSGQMEGHEKHIIKIEQVKQNIPDTKQDNLDVNHDKPSVKQDCQDLKQDQPDVKQVEPDVRQVQPNVKPVAVHESVDLKAEKQNSFSSLSHQPLPGILSSPSDNMACNTETSEEHKPQITETASNQKDYRDALGVLNQTRQGDSSYTGGYQGLPAPSNSQQAIGTIVADVQPQQGRQAFLGMCLDKSKIPEHLIVNFDDLEMGSKIGEGNFGKVCKAVLRKRVGQVSILKEDVAVKLLKDTAKKRDREDFIKEAENMLHLAKVKDHQYIISLVGVCFDPYTNVMMLITELAPRGSLLEYIRNKDNEKLLGIPRLLEFSLQIAKGMAYLEEQPIVHRDLAARNILVKREDLVKISDFGLSRMMDYYKVQEGKWPRKWYAPESLEFGRFKSKSDVWSYGVTLWEMFTMGQKPYPGISPAEILDYIKQGSRLPQPEGCPLSIYEVMKNCWHYEPMKRPTFYYLSEEILPELQQACAF